MPAITQMAPANKRVVPRSAWALLALIMVAGGVARFWNLDWDHGAYTLHPDEWALNEVVRRIFPDPNPHFFFYGGFPIYLDRFTAEVLSFLTGDNWLDRVRLALVGRFYSALESTLILPLLFDIGRRLWSVWAGLIAAACGAGAALLIQAAHFGTVDTLLTLEGMCVLWASLRIASEPRPRWYALAGVALGLAVATKLTGATLVLMPLLAHFVRSRRTIGASVSILTACVGHVGYCGLPAYVSLLSARFARLMGCHPGAIWRTGRNRACLYVAVYWEHTVHL